MNPELTRKLKELPKQPGVYFFKDKKDKIIYIGKAAVLSNRVKQYFQKSRSRDAKTEALVAEITNIDWQVVETEVDALFLEAELVRRYLPHYNILLRDDKSMTYVRISYSSDFPTVSTTRRPLDDSAKYFGPYLSAWSVRQALKLLRRVFPFATRRIPGQKRATLHYHLGLDPGLEEGRTSLAQYRTNLRRLMAYMRGNRQKIEKELETDMKKLAKQKNFEQAAIVRNQLRALKNLRTKVVFSDKEFLDISKDHALAELVDILGLQKYPQRIEGYDISHQQGTDVVASMVVFTNGASTKDQYRKFKTRTDKNDDFYNMNETIKRRLSEKNKKDWGVPDLILIDGGKGQLDAALQARDELGCGHIPFIGLAKRDEEIVLSTKELQYEKLNMKNREQQPHIPYFKFHISKPAIQKLGGFMRETPGFTTITLPKSANLVKLLQRIRDESHRFAISYHSSLKRKRQTASTLDDIPGIGPVTRKKLIKKFGSVHGIAGVTEQELEMVVGKKASVIKQFLNDS